MFGEYISLAMTRTNVSMCVFVPSVLQGESSFCIGPTLSLNLDTLDFWQDTKGFHVITHYTSFWCFNSGTVQTRFKWNTNRVAKSNL